MHDLPRSKNDIKHRTFAYTHIYTYKLHACFFNKIDLYYARYEN